METRTRGKGTIDRGLRGSMGTLDDMIPTRLSKRSQGCPLTESFHKNKKANGNQLLSYQEQCHSQKETTKYMTRNYWQ